MAVQEAVDLVHLHTGERTELGPARACEHVLAVPEGVEAGREPSQLDAEIAEASAAIIQLSQGMASGTLRGEER